MGSSISNSWQNSEDNLNIEMLTLRKKIAKALEGDKVLRNEDCALNHKGSGQGLRIQ